MRYYLLATTVGLLAYLALLYTSPRVSCRCRPTEPCWPNEEEWHKLNTSIDGSLTRLMPIGQLCHSSTLDETVCEELSLKARDSGWRASRPETLQSWLWEAGPSLNDSCLIGGPAQLLCNRGRVSRYSAAVKSPEDVRMAVLFAGKHNLRLVIKNTGHDGSGRSASPDSFQIHTHFLKGIQYHSDFVPQTSTTRLGPAVTIGAGVAQWELYEQGSREGYIIVGGECPTVGAAGGFLQGGGVSSFLSQKRGLAVDNVLEFEAVLANGDIVTANDQVNQDLFWALRGGGGGSFAVVTRATLRVHPNDPVVESTISVTSPGSNTKFWEKAIVSLLNVLHSLNQQDVAGQFLLNPSSHPLVSASLTLYFMNTTSVSAAEEKLLKYLPLRAEDQIDFHLTSRFLTQISAALRMTPDIYPEQEYAILQGSVLTSNKLFHSIQGRSRMAEIFSKLPLGPHDILFTSNLGGRINEVDKDSTSMHPAWRSAAQLVSYVRHVEPTADGKRVALQEFNQVQMPTLYSLEPGSKVSYLNLGDPSEKDFQTAFWGSSYRRLIRIKHKVDPDGLFVTRLGVGSEKWDEEGRCRRTSHFLF